MLWSIWSTVFIAAFLVTYGLAVAWARRYRVKERAGNPGTMPVPTILRSKSPFKEKMAGWLSFSGKWALPDLEKVSEMRKDLIQAGFRGPQAPAIYLGLRIWAAFVFPLPLLLFVIIRGQVGPLTLLMALCLSVFGFFLPAKILAVKVRHRQGRLDRALPDILDMFVICIEAGLSQIAAVHRVADQIKGVYQDFYEEMQIVAVELRTGLPWDEAFENLGQRTAVQSIRSMTALMVQANKLGASIGEALRHHGEFVRTQRILRAEENAAKLPIKMVFPLIFCIFPAIMIVIVGPGLIHIYDKFLQSGLFGGVGTFGNF